LTKKNNSFIDKNVYEEGFFGKCADIWALGVTLYALTFTVMPFNGENVIEIINNIQNERSTRYLKKKQKNTKIKIQFLFLKLILDWSFLSPALFQMS
jgi:hypothetical protein